MKEAISLFQVRKEDQRDSVMAALKSGLGLKWQDFARGVYLDKADERGTFALYGVPKPEVESWLKKLAMLDVQRVHDERSMVAGRRTLYFRLTPKMLKLLEKAFIALLKEAIEAALK